MMTMLHRDLRLAYGQRSLLWLPLGFFVIAVSLFPLGIGAEPQTLRHIAPGVVWVCALLATMLSITHLFAGDLQDGSLEQMLLAPGSATARVAGRMLAHWLINGLPLVAAGPVVGLLFDLDGASLLALCASLLLGTPVMSALGALGAALTLGLRSGAALIFLIVLPLTMPVLIFGAGAVGAISQGEPAQAHFSLLGALAIVSVVGMPLATAAALRIAME